MRKNVIILTVLLALMPAFLYAGITGKLAGNVKDKESGEVVVGASIVLEGTTYGGAADVQGDFFILNIPPGTYSVKVSAIGYQPVTVKNVQISADVTTKLDVSLTSSAVQVQEVVVQAERPLIERSTTTTVRTTSAEDIVAIPRENILGIVALSAGVVNNENFRGGRNTENLYQVDGLPVSDPQQGGTAGLGTYFPTVSNLAVEEVQVLTGGFTAEFGNALSGVVNTITKEGSVERYEGIVRYKRDFQPLYGESDKGYQLNGPNENLIEASFGGPLQLGWRSRFFVSAKFDYQKYRQAGYAFIDPAGKDIGKRDHDRYIERNVNAKFTANPTEKIKLTLSGFWGISMWEASSWTWLYGDYQQQPVYVQSNQQLFVRMTQTLTDATFYELTLTTFNQKYLSGKNTYSNYDNFNVFTGVFDPVGFNDANNDGIIDQYYPYGKGGYEVNPQTDHREGSSFAASTDNPYGVISGTSGVVDFIEFGNSRVLRQRNASYNSLSGFITSQVDKHNLVKSGFEVKLNKVHQQYNSLPWDANPFADKYTYKPVEASFYVQDKIEFQGMVVNPGIRFDYLDPQASKVSDLEKPFVNGVLQTTEAKPKYQFSPRFGIAFPITDRSKFFLNYGWYFQQPVLTRLYESITRFDLSRGNQIFGNPDLEPQKTKAFEIGYGNQFTDILALDVTAYYKDLYNIEGLTFVPAVPSSYSLYTTGEYGNVRGLEFTLTKRLESFWRARATYAYSVAKGTASSVTTNYQLVTNGPPDPYTGGSKVYPLTDYYLDFDRRHVVNLILDFVIGHGEGPTVMDIHLLQDININFTTVFQTGTPFTRQDYYGRQVGEFNGSRQPSFYQTDMRISRDIPMSQFFGPSFSRVVATMFVDVVNLFNRTAATSVFEKSGVADYDGFIVSTPNPRAWVRGSSSENTGVDQAGLPLYNKYIDLNNDGINDQGEKLYGINKLRQDYFDSRNYGRHQLARQVWIGFSFRF